MINTTGRPHPPLRSTGKLVLYDQLDQRPLRSVTVKGEGARLVVFPVLGFVKRCLHFPHLNHGVYIRLHSDFPKVKVMFNSTGPEAKDNRPLLVVKARSKARKTDALSFLTR